MAVSTVVFRSRISLSWSDVRPAPPRGIARAARQRRAHALELQGGQPLAVQRLQLRLEHRRDEYTRAARGPRGGARRSAMVAAGRLAEGGRTSCPSTGSR